MAESIEIRVGGTFSLDEPGAIYQIEKGRVSLFAIKKEHFFIASFEESEILFGLPHREGLYFALYGEEPTVLRKLPRSAIQDNQIESWIKKIEHPITPLNLDWREDLETFHASYFDALLQKLLEREKQSLERAKKKKREKEEILSEIELKMSSLLEFKKFQLPPSETEEDLFHAFYVIASQMGMTPKKPKRKLPSDQVSDHLEMYCKINRMRKRPVRLTKRDLEESSTHFLAFLKDTSEPVALIHKKQGHYEAITKKTTTKVDSLEPYSQNAYVFYETMPKKIYQGSLILKDYLSRRKKELLPLLYFGVLGSLFSLALPIATYLFFSEAIPNADLSHITQIVIGLILAGVCASSFFFFQSLIIARIEGMAENELELGIWDRLIKLPVHFFRQFSSGDLSFRVMSMERIRLVFTNEAAKALLSGIFSIGYLIVMAIFSIELTLVTLAFTLATLVFVWLICKKLVRLQRDILEISSKLNGFLVQIIRGIAKLRLARAETYAFAVWARQFIKNKRIEIQAQNHRNTILNLSSTFPFILYGALFSYVFLLEKMDEISIAQFLAFNTAFLAFTYAFLDVIRTLTEVVKVGPLWERTEPILKEDEEIPEENLFVEKLSGNFRLDGVSFRYDHDSPLILDRLNLKAKPGQSIAIVGPSGSGKSTIVRLLLGFETPQRGAVYYDARDLTLLDTQEVRRNIGVVMQSEGLISGTLFENLVRGSFFPKEAIDRALALSCFEQDMAAFPMGLHTYIPMNGETLSGGQKQRLLLARALLPEPNILIFDEATSALDNNTQDIISKNIDALDITRVIIAHRLSTIKGVDHVYVLDKGKLVQEGPYETLATKPGLFSTMLERQKLF